MINWMKPMDYAHRHIPTKTQSYQEGYRAYIGWSYEGGDRPDNPYWSVHLDGESQDFEQWQQGWDDASFDV